MKMVWIAIILSLLLTSLNFYVLYKVYTELDQEVHTLEWVYNSGYNRELTEIKKLLPEKIDWTPFYSKEPRE